MGRRNADSDFWDDFDAEMANPEFREEFERAHARTITVDRIVNQLDAQRVAMGITKAELARRLQTSAPSIRRLFSAKAVNPTIGTLAEVAAALGLQVTLEPVATAEPPSKRTA